MNYFEDYFYTKSKRPITKWSHYFEIYEKHFSKFRNRNVNLLEIGVGHGGSLQMWKGYFDSKSKIIGLDTSVECKSYEEDQIEIEIGSQYDLCILENLVSKYKSFDIIIDDGSHVNEHMTFTFNHLFKYLNEGGVYLIEDIHTSYFQDYGGGYKKEGTIMEFTKEKADQINQFYIDYESAQSNYFTKHLNNISIYDSIIVYEKKFRKTKPVSLYSLGNGNFPESNPSENINLDA